jgi:hypothetical protein
LDQGTWIEVPSINCRYFLFNEVSNEVIEQLEDLTHQLLVTEDEIVKHQHPLEIIDEHEDVGGGASEDGRIGLAEEAPCQREASQRCFASLVNLEEQQI